MHKYRTVRFPNIVIFLRTQSDFNATSTISTNIDLKEEKGNRGIIIGEAIEDES